MGKLCVEMQTNKTSKQANRVSTQLQLNNNNNNNNNNKTRNMG
jgi:hypothetical protein